MPEIAWNTLNHNRTDDGKERFHMDRAKIPGGWLVVVFKSSHYRKEKWLSGYGWGYGLGGLTFVPDPEHEWDGNSLE